jgi:hypothetical protein
MKNSFSKLLLAPLTILVLASFTLEPVAEARGGGGGGGGARAGGGGGGARASGGGGGRQADNSQRDARANDTRNTSVNNVNSNRNTNVNKNTNVNANRNVNVNVDNHGGGWDNDYHPVARAAAVTATVAVTAAVVGSMVNTVPANCVPVNYGGMVYQQCGSTWYQPQGSQYVVINPPY